MVDGLIVWEVFERLVLLMTASLLVCLVVRLPRSLDRSVSLCLLQFRHSAESDQRQPRWSTDLDLNRKIAPPVKI